IGGFLDTVVDKLVGALQPLDHLVTDRLPQLRVDLLLRGPVHESKCRGRGAVSQARQPVGSKYSNSAAQEKLRPNQRCLLRWSSSSLSLILTTSVGGKSRGGATHGLEDIARIHSRVCRSGTGAAQRVPGDRKSPLAQPAHGPCALNGWRA